MGISKFMILLIVSTVLFLLVEKDYLVKNIQKEENPTVSFFDSTMYEITQKGIEQIVKSKQADVYKHKEELQDATIIVKAKNDGYATNIGSSKTMIKIADKVFLTEDVHLQLASGFNIKTQQLNYNTKTKIANNSVPFLVTRDQDTFEGSHLFVNSITERITAEKTKFKMKVNNE